MEYIIGIALLIVIVVVIANNMRKVGDPEKLKRQYDELLNGPDKRAALAAGRAYYSALRQGKMLTVYDEQAISNDLSTMK